MCDDFARQSGVVHLRARIAEVQCTARLTGSSRGLDSKKQTLVAERIHVVGTCKKCAMCHLLSAYKILDCLVYANQHRARLI